VLKIDRTVAMTNPEKPRSDPQRLSAEQQKLQAAASRETKRPSDSIPLALGQFANLPAKFGRYEVERLLGRGAMGGVYLARDTELDRLVALKIPKVGASGSQRLLLRLKTEAKAAAKLDHPSLCKVYDAGEIDGQCFIAMQYIEGETLKSQLEARGKTVAEAVSLILQLAEGLSEAHKLGIIHRDLKPDNIIINRRGTPVIMDFGLAKLSTVSSNAGATQAGTILGTPAYMSPEQASGNTREIDQRSDIYALGTIFFELLTGQWPFSGSAMQILGQKALLDPASPISLKSDLPPQVATICHKMIAKNNVERYQTLSEVIHELKQSDSVATLAVSASSEQSQAATPVFPDFAALGEPDERSSSAGLRKKAKPTKGARPSGAAPTTLPHRLMAWWKARTPTISWTVSGGTGAILIVLGIILFFPTQHGIVKFEIDDPSLSVRFNGETISIDTDGRSIDVSPTAKHTFEILQDGVTIDSGSREVTVQRGQTRVVTLTLLGNEIAIDGKRIEKPLKVAKTGWQGWPVDAPSPAIAPFASEQAKTHQEAWAKYLGINTEYTNSIGMKFVLLPPGEFFQGSTPAEIEMGLKVVGNDPNWIEIVKSEGPQHKVILTQPIYIGVHEVTQGQYLHVMGTNPSHFAATGAGKELVAGVESSRLPVEMVSWQNAVEFCLKLSTLEKRGPLSVQQGPSAPRRDGSGYCLPTEAEWEFGCRAGTTTKFFTGDTSEAQRLAGWVHENSRGRTNAVGVLRCNPFGLYDTHGNVWEYVQDAWDARYYEKFREQPATIP